MVFGAGIAGLRGAVGMKDRTTPHEYDKFPFKGLGEDCFVEKALRPANQVTTGAIGSHGEFTGKTAWLEG